MTISYFIYCILKDPIRCILLRCFLILVLIFFDIGCTFCAPKFEIALWTDEQIISHFFSLLSDPQIPHAIYQESNPLSDSLDSETLNNFYSGVITDYKMSLEKNSQTLSHEELVVFRKHAEFLQKNPHEDLYSSASRSYGNQNLTVLEIIQEHLPNFKNGATIKGYLDSGDYRQEVKRAIRDFVFQEEKILVKYVAEKLFTNPAKIQPFINRIGN